VSGHVDWRPGADITRAELPPPGWYADEEVYARARERVFARSWQWVGDTRLAAQAGDVVPFTLLEGCLDEPLLLTNDGTRRHALANVCTHRAMALASAPTNARGLRCPYHGRRFTLDGRFVSSPGFEGAVDFPRSSDDLARAHLGTWAGQSFVALDPEHDFAAFAAPLAARLAHVPLERAVHVPSRDREFVFDAPWALYVENYLDGLHVPYLHASLNAAIDWSAYTYDLWDGGAWQIADARPGDPCFEQPPGHPEHGRRVAAFYALVFPNLMVNVYPYGVSLNLVRPLGPSRTAVRFATYAFDTSLMSSGAGADLDRVEREDEFAVVRVARGAASRLARAGRYAPSHETALFHFHRWLTRTVSDTGSVTAAT
jgi:choline monooxygenase